ncbi:MULTISPECIES: ATP-binding cassette domain-containing protein [Ochrobactrum]|uniref:ATP-binding cassette domain-containing protein n=1 Tax=Ochrobactrum chromiisoli TaxID=2993941 RepID=A0ABT3QT62_9HYPH|nr:ATP-binding cassette domain-containing protein [Ochrobactrum chromiisoli]MCX2698814.1 ATP-binding cassette domain-containing protein [Ochrobactrum chromiisoli]
MTNAAISVHNLSKTFGGGRPIFGKQRHTVEAVKSVSLTLARGETLAIVGESGSGKSTLARMLVGLTDPSDGTMTIAGQDASALRRSGPRAFGKVIQYVFQDPVASLNPRKTIRQILETPLKLLGGLEQGQRQRRMEELLDAVQMPKDTLSRYPHEFSGGQAQRIAIARTLAANAEIIVLDEPVSALDVSVQAQVLLLLDALKQEFGLSYLFISHDLAVVEAISDRVAVMYYGKIVEEATAEDLFTNPQHAYTRQLIDSAPRIKRE